MTQQKQAELSDQYRMMKITDFSRQLGELTMAKTKIFDSSTDKCYNRLKKKWLDIYEAQR